MESNLPTHRFTCPRRSRARARAFGFYLAALLVLVCACGAAWAQSDSDESDWRKFVDSVGKAVYFDAWPTATYQSVSFGNLTNIPGGVDVSFVVHGISAFDGGPLWTEVVLEMRNGKITDIRWGRNNAVLAAPGSTMKALGAALDELNKEYDQEHPAPTPGGMPLPGFSAVCIANPTSETLSYTLQFDGDKQDHTLKPGTFLINTSTTPSADFTLSFHDSFEDGYTDRTIHLTGTPRVDSPTTCDDDLRYDFVLDKPRIGLSPKKWIPGFEHPFLPNVVGTQKAGEWTCVSGQTWAHPDDANDLTCVPN